jgi:hypothetical protein
LVQIGIQIQTIPVISQTMQISGCVETSNLTMQSGQSKFIFWERKVNENFGGIYQIFPKKFGSLINPT